MWAFTPLRSTTGLLHMPAYTVQSLFLHLRREVDPPPPSPSRSARLGGRLRLRSQGRLQLASAALATLLPLGTCLLLLTLLSLAATCATCNHRLCPFTHHVRFSSVAHIHRIVPLDSGVLALLISPLLLVLLLLALPLPDLLLLPRSTICIGRPDCRPFAYATPSSTSDRNSNHLQTRTVYQS